MAPKSPSSATTPAPRRSSRASTPTNRAKSPSSGVTHSASTPSISSTLAPPAAAPSSVVRKSNSSRALSPKPRSSGSATGGKSAKSPASGGGGKSRPALPLEDKNELLPDFKGKLHKVKTQTLHLGPPTNDTIVIARVKCPVPKGVPGHLIKRFDTNAVSASSFFRAAFPTASANAETSEMKWITGHKRQFGDTKAAGREQDEAHRLSGTWIPADKALALAEEYGLTRFATDLINFEQPQSSDAVAEAQDSEAESPAVRSPRAKRARVASPRAAASPTPKSALSGASANGVSILQTLSTDAATGVTTETTEVKVDVPVSNADSSSNGLVASDEVVAEQIAQAKQLVEDLKASGTLAQLTEATAIPSSKRVHEEDEDELPQTGTMADALRDERGFFGKLFKRKPARRVPVNAGREIRAAPGSAVMVQREVVEGRRWVAGFGLALAVGATAAAPYLFG